MQVEGKGNGRAAGSTVIVHKECMCRDPVPRRTRPSVCRQGASVPAAEKRVFLSLKMLEDRTGPAPEESP